MAEDFISRMQYAPNTQVRRCPGPRLSSWGLLLLIWDKKSRKAPGTVRNSQASLPDPSSGKALHNPSPLKSTC